MIETRFTSEYLASLSDWKNHVPLLTKVFEETEPTTGLELGVCTGTSIHLFSQLTPDCLWHGVDAWSEEWGWTNRHPQEEAARRLANGTKITLFKGHFHPVCNNFVPHSFDVVHIDGEHDWFSVSEDWNLARRMAKPTGIVMLHDVHYKHCYVPDFWQLVKLRYKTEESPSECGLGIVYLDG